MRAMASGMTGMSAAAISEALRRPTICLNGALSLPSLWCGYAELVCPASLHGCAVLGLQVLVQADLYGCEVVVAAGNGKAAGRGC